MKTLPLVAALTLVLGAAAVHAGAPAGQRQKIDTNGDGVIDRSEAAAHPRLAGRFDTLDKNGDGKLDASERPQRGQGGQGGRQGGGMARLDANGDGVIDRSEVAAHPGLAGRFDSLDKNGDGKLDASERPQRGQGGQGGGMARLDANGDGVIDRSEVAAHPGLAGRFDSLDKNGDGKLDASERPQRGQGGQGGRHGDGMARLDVNGDGMITLEEAAGHQRLLEKFEQIDTNADASLSREELQAWRAQRGSRRGPGAQGTKP